VQRSIDGRAPDTFYFSAHRQPHLPLARQEATNKPFSITSFIVRRAARAPPAQASAPQTVKAFER
jgi:hypothetical protein